MGRENGSAFRGGLEEAKRGEEERTV